MSFADRYAKVKLIMNKELMNYGFTADNYYYYHLMDWGKLQSTVKPLAGKPKAIQLFMAFVMDEIYGTYIKEGDAPPAFWFNAKGSKTYIGFTKEDGQFVLLSTELSQEQQKDKTCYSWSSPSVVQR